MTCATNLMYFNESDLWAHMARKNLTIMGVAAVVIVVCLLYSWLTL